MSICGDCHIQTAIWFSHDPKECEDTDCICRPQCQDCFEYRRYLLMMIELIQN